MNVRDRNELVVERLEGLAAHVDGEPRPDWQATTRARLVAMAAVRSPAPEPVPAWRRLLSRPRHAAPSRRRNRLTAGLAGVALAVTALATLVAVSTDAGPGDPLYGIKRGTERTQLALAGDGRGQILLEFARTRLHELEELTGTEVSALPAAGAATSDGTTVLAADADPALVLETLAAMDAQTTEGAAWLTARAVDTGDGAPLELLATWSRHQAAGLDALREALPEPTVDELDGSLARLVAIATRTVALTDVLGCAAGVPVEGTDRFGPVPGLCVPDDQAPPSAGGNADPGTVPAPEAGSPSTGTAAVPTGESPAGGPSTGSPQPSGEGSGQGNDEENGPAEPSAEVPRDGSVPTAPSGPALPLPSISVGAPAPSSSTGAAPSSGAGSIPSSPIEVELCLGPLQINCSN